MADGELTLRLDDETIRRLKVAAEAVGRPMGEYAAALITERVKGDGWTESLRRLEEFDRTGESLSVQEAMEHFDKALDARLPDRA